MPFADKNRSTRSDSHHIGAARVGPLSSTTADVESVVPRARPRPSVIPYAAYVLLHGNRLLERAEDLFQHTVIDHLGRHLGQCVQCRYKRLARFQAAIAPCR